VGNSLAVRLPAAVVEALELREGEEIELHVTGTRSLEVSRKPGNRQLLARLRKYRGRLLDPLFPRTSSAVVASTGRCA
jgi:antitoxin MazE